MKIKFNSYIPEKVSDVYAFSFAFLPELSIFWLGGVKNLYISWLFWEIMFDFSKGGKE